MPATTTRIEIEAPDIIIEFRTEWSGPHYWEVWVAQDGSVDVFFENGNADTWPSYGHLLRYLRSKATVTDII